MCEFERVEKNTLTIGVSKLFSVCSITTAQTPGFKLHQGACGIDADCFDERAENSFVKAAIFPFGHFADGFCRLPSRLVAAIRRDSVIHIAPIRAKRRIFA